MSPAQYQLFLYNKVGGKPHELIKEFHQICEMSATSPSYSPIIDLFGRPKVPEFLKPKDLELDLEMAANSIYIGDNITSELAIHNMSTDTAYDVNLEYTVKTAEDERFISEKLTIDRIKAKSRKNIPIKFKMEKETSIVVFDVKVTHKDKSVTLSKTFPIKRFLMKVFWLGKRNYIPIQDVQPIPYSVQIENGLPVPVNADMKISIIEESSDSELYSTTHKINIDPQSRGLFVGKTLLIADWANEALETQQYTELPPLDVPVSKLKDLGCFIETSITFEGRTFVERTHNKFIIYRKMQ
jgi:hypothetical protein